MAFNKKTWVNRVVQYPLRRLLTIVRDFDTTGTAVMDIQREDGEVTTEGDAFSAANMNELESRIEDAFNSVTIDVDSSLSSTSENPVQNKVINNALSGKAPTNHASSTTTYGVGNASNYGHVKVDSSLSSTSTNPLQNKEVFSSLQNILGNLATYHVGNKATSAVTSGSYVVYGNPDNPHFAVANTAISSGTTFNSGTGGNVTNKKVADVFTTLTNELTHLRATGTGSTYSQQLSSLKSTFNALSDLEKARAYLILDGRIARCVYFKGLFSSFITDGANIINRYYDVDAGSYINTRVSASGFLTENLSTSTVSFNIKLYA